MEKQTNLPFNPKQPTKLHVDMNSCFSTIEQQANPKLRGKPIAVAAYTGPSGCIIAPSVEAKRLGIKVGMRVKDGKLIYPQLVVLPPDPPKYRAAHIEFRRILESYTDKTIPKSIDEFVLDLEGYPAFKKGMLVVAKEIKDRIKKEIGEWVTVSVGIGTNRFLAKTAAGLHKPDGLDVIDHTNYMDVYRHLTLTDLCGIQRRLATRLNLAGIHTVVDFYNADIIQVRAAFQSINSYYWYLRLKGWEIDDVEFGRHSYGNSYAIPNKLESVEELSPLLCKLVVKMGQRLRHAGYKAQGIHLALSYRDGDFWHHGVLISQQLFDSRDIYREALRLLYHCPYRKAVAILAVSCFDITRTQSSQLELFDDVTRKERLVKAIDKINERWGDYVITPAMMMGTKDNVPDRIAFGGVKELEEFITT